MANTDYRLQGKYAAYEQYGLTKHAGIRSWFKGLLPTKKGVKEFFFGQPGKFIDELSEGRALDKDSLIMQGLDDKGFVNKMFTYVLPAVETGSILADEEGDKAGRIGGAILSNVAAGAAWRPLGAIGSMVVAEGGRRLGNAVGTGFGNVTGLGNKVPPPRTNMYATPYDDIYRSPYSY